MQLLDSLIRSVAGLLVLVAVAVVVAQNAEMILSVLFAAILLLVIARLAWPSARR